VGGNQQVEELAKHHADLQGRGDNNTGGVFQGVVDGKILAEGVGG